MGSDGKTVDLRTLNAPAEDRGRLLEQYECGPIRFTGTGDALYDRRLLFDGSVDPAAVGPRV